MNMNSEKKQRRKGSKETIDFPIQNQIYLGSLFGI